MQLGKFLGSLIVTKLFHLLIADIFKWNISQTFKQASPIMTSKRTHDPQYTTEYICVNIYIYVTLSVKTQLKSFFCVFLFSTKNHPTYGKEHSVKCNLYIFNID